MGLVSLLFGFSGRINRVQYWLGCVIGGVGGAMLLFMLTLMALPPGGFPKTPDGFLHFISSVGFAFGIPMLLMSWMSMALQTKRFHDRGRSGLWVLAPMLPVVMIVSNVIGGAASGAHMEQVASSIALWWVLLQVINMVMFVDLGCMAGRPEANKYGTPPGGGFSGGGGAPIGGAPIPGQSSAKPAKGQAIPGMGSTLTSAESAIERAIAAKAKQAQAAPLMAAPRPAMAVAQPVAGVRPAAGGSFGRKTTR